MYLRRDNRDIQFCPTDGNRIYVYVANLGLFRHDVRGEQLHAARQCRAGVVTERVNLFGCRRSGICRIAECTGRRLHPDSR